MSKFFKSVNGFLNNKIGKEMGKLDPRISGLVGSFFPGLGGGIENYQNNEFLSAIANSSEQLQQQVDNAGAISTKQGKGKQGMGYDWRARLRPKNQGIEQFYGFMNPTTNISLMDPLKRMGGMVWQTTPQIYLAGQVDYNEHLGHGMNYPIYTYNNSRPPPLPVTAEFYANDIFEAQYLLAVMHFIRTCTKSYFGEAALVPKGTFGTPPPVLVFEYMGDHGFNKVPVIMRSFSIELPDSVDYIPVVSAIDGESQTTYVPTRTNIMVDLAPAYTPKKIREKYDLDAFRSGKLYKDGFI